jgi:hypothetical protein
VLCAGSERLLAARHRLGLGGTGSGGCAEGVVIVVVVVMVVVVVSGVVVVVVVVV